jgi:hypothetical protein
MLSEGIDARPKEIRPMRFHRIIYGPRSPDSHRVVAYDLAAVKYTRLLRTATFNTTDLYAITLMLEGAESVDYLPNPLSLPLCSHRFRDTVLALCPGQVEFVPVRLHSPSGVNEQYLFMNVLNCIDCVDMDRSLVPRRTTEKRPHVIEFAFAPDRIPNGTHILRVPEAVSPIFLSETLARSFTGGFTGFGFLPNRV